MSMNVKRARRRRLALRRRERVERRKETRSMVRHLGHALLRSEVVVDLGVARGCIFEALGMDLESEV